MRTRASALIASQMVLAAALSWAGIAAAGPGLEGEAPVREPRAELFSDPLVKPGLIVTSVGVASSLAGAVVSATAQGKEVCGITGCFRRNGAEWSVVGGALLGNGIALTSLGLPTLLAGIARERSPEAEIGSSKRTAGIALTSSGLALMGTGIGAIVADASKGEVTGVGAGILIPTLVVGSGLVIGGAVVWSRAGRVPDPPLTGPTVPKSPTMMYAGIALTVVGVSISAAGVATFVSLASKHEDFAGLQAAVIGGPITGIGVISTAVGGVLWGLGARRVAAQTALVPAVRLSPSYGELTWRF